MATKIQQITVTNEPPANDEMGVVVRVVGGSGSAVDATIVAPLPLPVEITTPLGSRPSAESVSVALASDQIPLDVTGPLTDTELRASPVPVRNNPSFDSGLVILTNSLTILTTSTILIIGILICNLTTSVHTVTVTNTAGIKYLNAYPLQGNMTVFIPMGGIEAVGVKWNADANDSVTAQLVGEL